MNTDKNAIGEHHLLGESAYPFQTVNCVGVVGIISLVFDRRRIIIKRAVMDVANCCGINQGW
jgi:hypothetical protein